MEKIKIFFNKKYVKLSLLAVALVISIKPFLFTWNFIRANYHLRERNQFKAGAYMANALSFRPSVYRVFNRQAPGTLEKHLVKSAILNNDKEFPQNRGAVISPAAIGATFSDNFYLGHLLGHIGEKRDWQNLDPVSLELLADPRMNERTIAILKKIAASLDKPFIKNLADFVTWQGNPRLSDYLVSTHRIPAPINGAHLPGPGYNESLTGIKNLMRDKYKLPPQGIGENLVQCPGFNDQNRREKKWNYSRMCNGKFSRGSFYIGTDHTGKNQNPVIRIMGFFISDDTGKYRPRAGVRVRKKIPAENGFYLFGFDYCTLTGRERPSFFLSKGVEKQLPAVPRQWKKVIFILNNAFNHHKYLDPLVRMWGTGTLLVDNVFLAKTGTREFSIPGPSVLHIENIPPAAADTPLKKNENENKNK